MPKKIVAALFLISLVLASCVSDEDAWKSFSSEKYLGKYPKGKHSFEAVKAMEGNILAAANRESGYPRKEFEDLLSDYRKLVNTLSDRRYGDDLRDELERLCLERAESAKRTSALKSFLELYPEGRFRSSAATKLEELYYLSAAALGTIPAFEDYMKSRPRGPFVEKAKNEIETISAGRHPAFRKAKTIRLELAINAPPECPIDFIDEAMLVNSGLTIVPLHEKKADASLRVEANFVALSAYYGRKERPYEIYTGASIWGKMSLDVPGIYHWEKKFGGRQDPPPTIERRSNDVLYGSTPCSAPFRDLILRDDIHFRFGEMVLAHFGPSCLIPGLKQEEMDSQFRGSAERFLKELGKPALGMLINALKGEDAQLRRDASRALEKITGQDFDEDVQAWNDWREHVKSKPEEPAAQALGRGENKTSGETPVVDDPPIRAAGDVKAPELLKDVSPIYPEIAKRARREGTVLLLAHMDRDGRISSCDVLNSIDLLDQAAIDAVRQRIYKPMIVDGKPRRMIFPVAVKFQLGLER